MTLASDRLTRIIRTERGLTISGTRITLYDVMDYLKAQYPPLFIQGFFELTTEQINVALTYITDNADAVEAEYQAVLKEAEELQLHYEEENRDLIVHLATQSPKPGQEAIRSRLQVARAKWES